MLLIASLLGITIGNARIAEFFRGDRPGQFAAIGDATATLLTPVAGGRPAAFDQPPTPTAAPPADESETAPTALTLEPGWTDNLPNVHGVFGRPAFVVAREGYAAVVSSDYESFSVSLSIFDAADGTWLWSAPINDHVDEGSWGWDSAPVIADGKAYVVNRAGFLYGFDIASYPVSGALFAQQLPFPVTASSPVLLDGVLYVTGGIDPHLPTLAGANGSLFVAGNSVDGLVAVDPESGQIRWELPVLAGEENFGVNGLWQIDPGTRKVTNAWQVPNLLIGFVTVLENGLLAVSLLTMNGRPIGVSFRDPTDITADVYTFQPPDGLWEGRPSVAGDAVVIMASDPGNTLALTVLDPLRPTTPITLPWNYLNAPSKPDPTIGGSSTVIVSDDDLIRVYDPTTGAVLEETPIGTSMGEINAIDTVDDAIYVAFEDGTVARFDQMATDAPPVPGPPATPATQ